MYSNTGYLYDEDIELEDKNHPLTVCSCGIYRLIHQAAMTTILQPAKLFFFWERMRKNFLPAI